MDFWYFIGELGSDFEKLPRGVKMTLIFGRQVEIYSLWCPPTYEKEKSILTKFLKLSLINDSLQPDCMLRNHATSSRSILRRQTSSLLRTTHCSKSFTYSQMLLQAFEQESSNHHLSHSSRTLAASTLSRSTIYYVESTNNFTTSQPCLTVWRGRIFGHVDAWLQGHELL